MRILLVIDHFGSGGAQRQIVELACGLKRRGHTVEMFSYFPEFSFFRTRVDEQRIPVHEYHKGRGFSIGIVRQLAALIRRQDTDVVVSYLTNPNIFSELAQLTSPHAKLVVSERTSYHDDRSAGGAFLRRLLHGVADHVVANSQGQRDWLARKWWLKDKVSCIYNGVEMGPATPARAGPVAGDQLRLVAVGRVGAQKNPLNLLQALISFHRRNGYAPHVSWVGDPERGAAAHDYRRQLDSILAAHPQIGAHWKWLGVEADIPRVLDEHHALVHPSFYEGLPNAICEALAAGMPVLASNVCDHPLLVANGQRGFLFDPRNPESTVAAIERLVRLDASSWRAFSDDARSFAERNLNVERMVSEYENLFRQLVAGDRALHRVTHADHS